MSAILNVLSGTKNDIRDKKRYQGQKNDIRDKKRYQGDISFLCPPIINLIKAQVCDKEHYGMRNALKKKTNVESS